MTTGLAIKVGGVWVSVLGTVPPPPVPNVPPVAALTATASGRKVTVDASASTDADGSIASYSTAWGDGTTPTTGRNPSHTYASDGTWTITLTVTDNQGATATATTQVTTSSAPPVSTVADWKVGNEPWKVGLATDDWSASALASIVDYATYSNGGTRTFEQTLDAAVAAKPYCIVRLPAGTFTISSFSHLGSDRYSYGYWNKKLGGLLGAGVEQTFIRIAKNCMTPAQITEISKTTTTSPVGIAILALGSDADTSKEFHLAGLTLDGQDQQDLTAGTFNGNAIPAGPAPHLGFQFMGGSTASSVQNVRLRGFGRALMNVYPFELGALNTSSLSNVFTARRFELDGRLASSAYASTSALAKDSTLRRSGGIMPNATGIALSDFWVHDTARSGVALYGKTGNAAQAGKGQTLTRGKIEHVSNVDDAFGGKTGFNCINHEQCIGPITHKNVRMQRDNIGGSNRYSNIAANSNMGDAAGILYDFDDASFWANPPAEDNGCFSVQMSANYGSTTNIYADMFKAGKQPVQVKVGGKLLQPVFITSGSIGSFPTVSSSHTAAQLAAAGYKADTAFLIKVV